MTQKQLEKKQQQEANKIAESQKIEEGQRKERKLELEESEKIAPFIKDEQRRVEMTPDEEEDEKDEEPEPKKGKSSPVKGAKGMSGDSDEDSPTPPPSPPAKLQSWRWDLFYRQHAPCQSHRKGERPSRSDMMWRCGDPPSMWQMCDSPNEESSVVGLTTLELGNLCDLYSTYWYSVL